MFRLVSISFLPSLTLALALILSGCSGTMHVKPVGRLHGSVHFEFHRTPTHAGEFLDPNYSAPSRLALYRIAVDIIGNDGCPKIVWEIERSGFRLGKMKSLEYGAEPRGFSTLIAPQALQPGYIYRVLVDGRGLGGIIYGGSYFRFGPEGKVEIPDHRSVPSGENCRVTKERSDDQSSMEAMH